MKTKSLNIDAIVSPEVGLVILAVGLALVIIGNKQSKKEYGFDDAPTIKPALKEILGVFLLILGFIQILPYFGSV